MREQGRQLLLGYLTAIAAPAAAALAHRFVLTDILGADAPFALFVLAVVAAAGLGRLKAGLLATVLGAGAGSYFFIARNGWHLSTPGGRIQIVLFLLTGAAISWFAERMQRSRDRAARQRESLRITLASMGDAVIATDADGRVTSLNSVAAALTGWGLNEAAGRPLEEVFRIVNEQTRRPVDNPVKRVLAEGRIVGLANHTLLIAKDGTERPIDDSAAPIQDADGMICGVVLSFRDISERKKLLLQLQEADRRKDEFLATLAHELRNPLAAIRNALQILRLAADNKAAVEQARPVMERQVQQMVRLIDDLLDVSRIALQKLQLRKERVELAQVVRHAVESAHLRIETAGHELTVALPNEPIPVNADEARLTQVFSNLLDNAAKYTERGGRIDLTIQREGSEAIVRVRDTGIGIAAAHLPHIFEMFAQLDPLLERAQGGLGIGLTLVKRLVEMHGGTVEARSEGRNQGSEFSVRLPVDAGVPVPRQPASVARDYKAAIRPCKVLIVDDREDTAASMRTILHMLGYEARIAHDGIEAVESAESFLPNVIFLDLSLPKLNGYEAAQRIRQQRWGQTMKLVAMTGWAQEEDKQRSTEAGFDHYLIKPVEPAEVEELLRKLCPSPA